MKIRHLASPIGLGIAALVLSGLLTSHGKSQIFAQTVQLTRSMQSQQMGEASAASLLRKITEKRAEEVHSWARRNDARVKAAQEALNRQGSSISSGQ